MSRLTDLLRAAKQLDPQLGEDLEAEVRPLQERLPFGLNFERHAPEAVELAGHKIRRGSRVRVLPPRGSTERGDQRIWTVTSILGDSGSISTPNGETLETATVKLDDLIVVAEFRDRIYPGLSPGGSVERGGNKPFHTVINGENFHVLEQLTFTHEKSIDAIYIDPPYNTGASDWKYNNDYVEDDDLYRHSKWLAFMERRLNLAKRLLNPNRSTLIVTIDEKEYLRLGLLLEQVFPESKIQMVTSVISQRGTERDGGIARVDEYLFFVFVGNGRAGRMSNDSLGTKKPGKKRQIWYQYRRNGKGSLRSDSPGSFFPLFIDKNSLRIVKIGHPLPPNAKRSSVSVPDGLEAVWPLRNDGTEARWRTARDEAIRRHELGLLRVGDVSTQTGQRSVMFVNAGGVDDIVSGQLTVTGRNRDGSAIIRPTEQTETAPKSVWNIPSHDAGWYGSKLIENIIPGRQFDYPKSLYAVEDALSLVVGDLPNATILDFFAGSGTTAHAVMRLNNRDSGRRQCISVTNNEVSSDEQVELRKAGLRPGDPEWEQLGICEYVTKPRLRAAITGKTPDGDPINGDYKFFDESPMSVGCPENVAFFTLTYESPWKVSTDRAFTAIAPMLWLRAGAVGRRIDTASGGWDVADSYGIINDLDCATEFLAALAAVDGIRVVYIVTDDEGRFQQLANEIPGIETVRLYEDYLRNCEVTGDF